MTVSLSQTTAATCPQCRRTFEAEIWLIVDAFRAPAAETARAGH